MTVTPSSLQQLIDSVPNLVEHLYNDTPGPHGRTTSGLTTVPAEWTNWRDEQRAWRNAAILFDQSHHMPELFVKGPDARRLLNGLGVNSFANLRPGVAKQFVACNADGMVIGDSILHDRGDDTFELISGKPVLNWVEYHAATAGFDVSIEKDNNTSDNPTGRRVNFRFGLDGPRAGAIFDEIVEVEPQPLKFFHTAQVRIAGVEVLALRHGMAGHRGVELSGPFEDGPRVREAIIEAGEKHGLRLGGTRAYYSTLYESGWIGYPLPAVYTGDAMRAYREWLPADGWEAKFQIGGSFVSSSVEDYYVSPFDLGYERIVNDDHDFVGRGALQEIAGRPHRTRVTLVWDKDDVTAIFRSLLEPGIPYKYIELPVADFAMPQRDEVRLASGELVGLSTYVGYSANEKDLLSLAMIDAEHAAPGTPVTVTWGEPEGGSRKPRVEEHRQLAVRATVAPAPYSTTVRAMKRAMVG